MPEAIVKAVSKPPSMIVLLEADAGTPDPEIPSTLKLNAWSSEADSLNKKFVHCQDRP